MLKGLRRAYLERGFSITTFEELSKLFHLDKVMELVGMYPKIGDLAVVELMKERGVPAGATKFCLRAGVALGAFWCPKPHVYALARRLVNV